MGIISFFGGAIAGAPFVPSSKKVVEEMILLAGDMQEKNVYDLGCGDGRLVFAASRKGARAIGVEISLFVATLANIRKYITGERGIIHHGSLWDENLEDADIIFVYLLPNMMKRFAEIQVPTLKKGCIIISHGFALPNNNPIHTKKLSSVQGRVLVYKV